MTEKTFGWAECPHCGEKRQGADVMQEHLGSKHPDRVRIQGAPEAVGGEAVLPDDIVEQLDSITATLEGVPEVVSRDAEMVMRQSMASGTFWNGKALPEFTTMWRNDGKQTKVHSKRILEVLRKGYTLRQPPAEVFERNWFHWECPVPNCITNRRMCQLHNQRGSDSNHDLHSADYMVLNHLQTGGKIHRQYFEMHKEDLKEKYKAAFRAFDQELQDAERTRRERQEAAV